jgi:hypothetical protein
MRNCKQSVATSSLNHDLSRELDVSATLVEAVWKIGPVASESKELGCR